MPSTRNYDDTHDAQDTYSMGDDAGLSHTTLDYVQYTTPRKNKRGGKNVILYPSNNPSRFIVNAITGHKYNGIYARSNASRRFFRVTDSSAPVQTRVGEDGLRRRYNPKDSNAFYYDSPEEYVRHAKLRDIRPNISKTQMFEWHTANREEFGDDEFLFVGEVDGDGAVGSGDGDDGMVMVMG